MRLKRICNVRDEKGERDKNKTESFGRTVPCRISYSIIPHNHCHCRFVAKISEFFYIYLIHHLLVFNLIQQRQQIRTITIYATVQKVRKTEEKEQQNHDHENIHRFLFPSLLCCHQVFNFLYMQIKNYMMARFMSVVEKIIIKINLKQTLFPIKLTDIFDD
jgi:hypothetical protein